MISIRHATSGVVGWERVVTTFPQLFGLATLLEDLDFSFQFLRVVPGAA